MIHIMGKHTNAIIHTNEIDTKSLLQIQELVDSPVYEGSVIRIMPDVHLGVGSVIGFTATLTGNIVPNVIGVDIGCGVTTKEIVDVDTIDFEQLDLVIRGNIPSGFISHYSVQEYPKEEIVQLKEVCKTMEKASGDFLKQVGTLGGGNHFIEVNENDGKYYLTIHSGSRNFGYQIANFYQDLVDKDTGYLNDENKAKYCEAMKVAQKFASINRDRMINTIFEKMGWSEGGEVIESIHNYIDFEHGVMRKGAISAQEGERVVIPLNMKQGVIVGTGLGNPNWNYSAPHGAGRKYSRNKAKKELSLEKFKEDMDGIYTTCVSEKTLDESPDAYKDSGDILTNLTETVDVDFIAKAVYNYKA